MDILNMPGRPLKKYGGDCQMIVVKQRYVNQLFHMSNRPMKLIRLNHVSSCKTQDVKEYHKYIAESPTQESHHERGSIANSKYIDNCSSERCQYVVDLHKMPYSETEYVGRRKEPSDLPGDLEWCTCDVNSDDTLVQIYDLLSANYIEDNDHLFRMNYSKEFLQWALQPPGYFKNWHVGVRTQASHKLVAFISAVPARIKVKDLVTAMAEVNFLCVDKKLRSKRLATLLIKEITRRANMENIWQGIFTADVIFQKHAVRCQYWHRPLNPIKLVAEGFIRIGTRMTTDRMVKLYNLPESTSTSGFRKMENRDVANVHHLLRQYLSQFIVSPDFDEKNVAYWLLPVDNVISSFVVQDPVSFEITDICSFYTVPFTVLDKNNTYINAAYSYYNVSTRTPLPQLMKDAIIMAKRQKCDVFNVLDIMHNHTFLKKLKFSPGDGHLHYHLYNCELDQISPSNLGLVLL